jgi:hypothetical protein
MRSQMRELLIRQRKVAQGRRKAVAEKQIWGCMSADMELSLASGKWTWGERLAEPKALEMQFEWLERMAPVIARFEMV